MRNTGVILVIAATVALVATVVFFSFAPLVNNVTANSAAVTASEVAPEMADLYSARAAALQDQIDQLEQAVSERQATYAEQLVTLEAAQVTTAQHLSALEEQEQLLRQQLDEVSAVRAARNAQFAQQLEQVQGQYTASAGEITARLNEAQARLGEANQLLGR